LTVSGRRGLDGYEGERNELFRGVGAEVELEEELLGPLLFGSCVRSGKTREGAKSELSTGTGLDEEERSSLTIDAFDSPR